MGSPVARSEIPKDAPPNQPREKRATTKTHVIPAELWLGTETEPGLIDYELEVRTALLAEVREDKGPMWGPPEWTPEDERRWQTRNSR